MSEIHSNTTESSELTPDVALQVINSTLVPYQMGMVSSLDPKSIPADINRGNGDIYFVKEMPDYVVRGDPGDEPTPEHTQAIATELDKLQTYGVSIIPYVPIERDGEVLVVTKKVTGTDLDEAIRNNRSPELTNEIDNTWSGLANYLADAKLAYQTHDQDIKEPHQYINATVPHVHDVYAPNQYMYGTVVGDSTPRVRLIDLGTHVFKSDELAYQEEMLSMSNHIVELEKALGAKLPNARTAIERAIDAINKEHKAAPTYLKAVRHVLDNSVVLVDDDYDEFEELVKSL